MIEHFQLLRNVGLFENVDTGAQLPLSKLTLIYAENGRGKTTLAAILRSLGKGNGIHIEERQRLGTTNPPHVVVTGDDGNTVVFQNGNWTNTLSDIAVFDDHFIANNVCSGLEVATEHRQNLHELIIGDQGFTLNANLQTHITRVEEHNRSLQVKAQAIPEEIRGTLSVEGFCALENLPNIDQRIQETERNIAAGQAADAIRQQPNFAPIDLPQINLSTIKEILKSALPELETAADERVKVHFSSIGDDGETWVCDGMKRIEEASLGHDHKVCPFCAQDLGDSSLIKHYQTYFSEAYSNLKQSIADIIQTFFVSHSGEVVAAFERSVRVAIEGKQFWEKFTDIPEVILDTAAIARAWKKAVKAITEILKLKQSSPLEKRELSKEVEALVREYEVFRDEVVTLNHSLQLVISQIAIVKENAAAADMAALKSDLKTLNGVKGRFRPDIIALCDKYLQEKEAKRVTEQLRDAARTALNQYRNTVFPSYQNDINTYLQHFNAGFRLDSVESRNISSGSSCTYTILINQVKVPLSHGAGPSF